MQQSFERTWYIECPTMNVHIRGVMIESLRFTGARSSSASVGGSVASASDASESMIMLIQSIWVAVIGGACNRARVPWPGQARAPHAPGVREKVTS